MTHVRAGFEISSGDAVSLPIGHLGIFGQTRRAGKTTTLRTLIDQLCDSDGLSAIVFRTGRGEIPFPGAVRLTPFFRERLDWHSVEAMLWSFLNEKPKVYRPLVMRAVHGAHSLEDVHRNFLRAGKGARDGWLKDKLHELDEYFQELLPWIRGHRLGTELRVGPGVHVVDLEGWPLTVQQLVVAATLDRLMEEGRRRAPLIVVLPEARNFIPSDRATPAKLSADRFSREGAKLNLFLWIDSQALTGVDQQILRNFALLLQGVQTSDLEVRRICNALDGVTPTMVRRLHVGDFLLSTEDGVRTVHIPLVEPKEDNMDETERKGYEERIRELTDQLAALRVQLQKESYRAEANAKAAAANAVEKIHRDPTPNRRGKDGETPDEKVRRDALPGEFAPSDPDRGVGERTKADLHLFTETPDLTVHVKVVRIDANEDDHIGKLAKLLHEGFFDDKISTGPIGKEYAARGWENPIAKGGGSGQALRTALRQLCSWGFMREFNGMFGAVPEAKKRIRVKEDE